MKVVKVLDCWVFKTCKVRREIVEYADTQLEWIAAHSLIDGSYIGSPKNADYYERKGIVPQSIDGDSNRTACIGFCESEQKWYGWSHRAMCSFGIGSEVKKGDCAYEPTNPKDMLDDMINFWIEKEDEYTTKDEILRQELCVDGKEYLKYTNRSRNKTEYVDAAEALEDVSGDYYIGPGILLETTKIRKKDNKRLTSTHWEPYPEVWGRGEWVAKTLEDAKEMAIAFAKDVS